MIVDTSCDVAVCVCQVLDTSCDVAVCVCQVLDTSCDVAVCVCQVLDKSCDVAVCVCQVLDKSCDVAVCVCQVLDTSCDVAVCVCQVLDTSCDVAVCVRCWSTRTARMWSSRVCMALGRPPACRSTVRTVLEPTHCSTWSSSDAPSLTPLGTITSLVTKYPTCQRSVSFKSVVSDVIRVRTGP